MTASKNIKMEAAYRAMVDRFLGWKLPQDFGPDAGISFTPPPHLPDLYWPTGTNLFHAGQALEMFKHCVELPSAAAVRLAEKNLFDAQEAAKTIAKQAIAAEAERDALVAKLKDAEHDRDEFRRVMNGFAEKMAELEGQEPVAWVYDWQAPEGLIRDWSTNNAAEIPEGATNIRPLFARQVPAEPVNVRPKDMLGAQTTVDAQTVDRAWARFCGAFGDGPDAPYPGMIAAFETHYGQSFRDKEWRTEAACWAAAWSKAAARAESSLSTPQSDALEQVRAEEREACIQRLRDRAVARAILLEDAMAAIRARGQK